MRPSVSLEGDRVTPTLDQAARLKQLNKPDATNANETSGGEELVPGVFLMANSLETGGGERQFAALARSLDPAAFRLYLGCIQQRGPFLDSLGEVAQFRLGGSLYGLRSLRARFRLARHLRRCGVAIAHAFDFYTNLTLIPAARIARVRVVIGSQRQLGDLLSRAQSCAQAAIFRCCDSVVCNSLAAANRLVEQGLPKQQVVVIGNGLPPAAFVEAQPALPRRPGLSRVGMIARMNARYKNHRAFLHAAARIRGSFPTLEFVVVGDGPLRPELEREAESLGLGHQVHFLGDRRDIPAVLASLDISVLPSASESLSNVILESMAAGVAVVASRVGGNPELVAEDRGVLIAPDDSEALAGAIECLLRDAKLRLKLSRNAKQFVAANFSLEKSRKRYEELYAKLLAKKGWHPTPRLVSRA